MRHSCTRSTSSPASAQDGYLLVNTTHSLDELGLGELAEGMRRDRLAIVPATQLALEHLVGLCRTPCSSAAWRRLSGVVSLDAVVGAIKERFTGPLADGNGRRSSGLKNRRRTARGGGESCYASFEGSRAVAMAVAACRPQVVCAYPITPQTHIVEGVGEMVKSGELAGCGSSMSKSEFAAMSVAIGASAAGSRAYTATSSQGLLFMIEAVYNAGGLGLPVVMTLCQPGDRGTHQHLERPQRRDGRTGRGVGDALRRVQPGSHRPAQSRRSASPRTCRCPSW